MKAAALWTFCLCLLALVSPALAQQGGCVIKGTISDKGERIYHVPGGASYSKMIVSPGKGERWFCSEAEAVKAGWRRSKR